MKVYVLQLHNQFSSWVESVSSTYDLALQSYYSSLLKYFPSGKVCEADITSTVIDMEDEAFIREFFNYETIERDYNSVKF
jgi:hypothetical protein